MIANAVASKVALSQAEQTLKDMIIRVPVPKLLPPSLTRTSPLSYGMTRRQVSEGQMIKEGEAVAELVIEDPIRLWSQVPEQYSEDVQVGQRVRLSTRAHPGVFIEGKVARINPSVDSASRTFQVETLVPNERGLLRPGGFAKASIITDAEAKGIGRFPSIRSSDSQGSPSSSSSKTARRDQSTTSRPVARDAAGSRSRASCSQMPPPSSPPDKPSSRTAPPS